GLDAALESGVKSLVACGPNAVRIQKRLIMDWDRMSPTEGARAGIQAFVDAYRTDEPKRYMTNFLNRRRHSAHRAPPRYRASNRREDATGVCRAGCAGHRLGEWDR